MTNSQVAAEAWAAVGPRRDRLDAKLNLLREGNAQSGGRCGMKSGRHYILLLETRNCTDSKYQR